jgi:SP family facilitated glucose transporter-like MFS transporter 1
MLPNNEKRSEDVRLLNDIKPLRSISPQKIKVVDSSATDFKKPEQNSCYTTVLILTVFASAFGSSFQSGYHTGCVNPIGKEASAWYNVSHQHMFGKELSKQENTIAWSMTVGLLNVGGLFGGFIACHLADKFGRRNALLMNNAFLFIGVILMSMSKRVDVYLLLPAGRFVTGVCCGLGSAVVPMYLTEIAPVSKRGALGTAHQLTFTFSMLVSQIVGIPQIFGNADFWQYTFAIALIPAVIQICLLPLCPESPKFSLIVKKDHDKASRDLRKLRASKDVHDEIGVMKYEADKTAQIKKVTIPELFANPLYQRRIVIAVMLMLALQFSGINAVFFYSRAVFEQAGLSGQWPFYATIGMGFLNFFATICASQLMDHPKFGRRVLHLGGLIGMFFSTIMIVLSMTLSKIATSTTLQNLGTFGSIVFVLFFVASFASGPGPIPWFYVSEIFPAHAKASAASVAVMTCWIAGALVGIAFLPINNILGHYSFLIFSCFLLWFIFFTYKFVPETKGKTVAEVEKELGLDTFKH